MCPEPRVCAGAVEACGGAAGWLACTASEYGTQYEASESRCDGMDNDCDGQVDEGCSCVNGYLQICGSDVGSCVSGTQTCAGAVWGVCAGEEHRAPRPATTWTTIATRRWMKG